MTTNEVLTQRATQYGSFESNLRGILEIRRQIHLRHKLNKLENWRMIDQQRIIDFIKFMLSLKATRSLVATGEALEDCKVDFINYYNLYRGMEFSKPLKFGKNFNPIFNLTDGKWDFQAKDVEYIYKRIQLEEVKNG